MLLLSFRSVYILFYTFQSQKHVMLLSYKQIADIMLLSFP